MTQPDPDSSINYILVFLLFVVISAFFALSEAAIVALSDSKTKRLAEEGDKKAKAILQLVSSPVRFLATIEAGTMFSALLAVALVTGSCSSFLQSGLHFLNLPMWVWTVASTVLLSYFILIFGSLLPRRLAGYFPETISNAVVTPLKILAKLLSPMVWVLSFSTDLFLRLSGQNPHADLEAVTEEEIRMMVDVGKEKGAIEQSEKEMIENIFEFDNRTVEEIMTHRLELVAVENDESLKEILVLVKEKGYSRIPVYEENLDNIVGILYVKDLLGLLQEENSKEFEIEKYTRKPFHVPSTTRCVELFRLFKEKKLHMAIVVDEYGGTDGIITMEDLLESIVGNIQDEYDNEEDEFLQVSEFVYEIDGWASIEEVKQKLGITVSDDSEYDTLGGVIIDALGTIPKDGELAGVQIGNVLFTPLIVEENRIVKLRAEILSEPPVKG